MFLIPLVLAVAFAFAVKKFMDHRGNVHARRAQIEADYEQEDTVSEIFRVTLTIDDEPVLFEFDPSEQTPESMATQYCEQEHKIDKNDADAMQRCVEPVSKALADRLERANEVGDEEESRRLILEVNGVEYHFEYHRDMDSSYAAARLAFDFCTSKGEELGFGQADIDEALAEEAAAANIDTRDSEEEKLGGVLREACIIPMANRLQDEIEQARESE